MGAVPMRLSVPCVPPGFESTTDGVKNMWPYRYRVMIFSASARNSGEYFAARQSGS